MAGGSADLKAFLAARDFLLKHREDYDAAYRGFEWPQLTTFNWAFDYFDELGREDSGKIALWIVEDDGSERRYSFAEMSRRSNQVGNFLRRLGVMRGSRIVVMNLLRLCSQQLRTTFEHSRSHCLQVAPSPSRTLLRRPWSW